MATLPRYVGTDAATAQTYVRETVGPADFLRVFGVEGNGTIAPGSNDEKAFVRAVCASETEIDEHLAVSHGAPFTGTIPDSIREIAALRCLWCGVRTRAMQDGEKAPFRMLYKDTDARLERLKKDNGGRIPEVGAPQPIAGVLASSFEPPATPWSDAANGTRWSGF